MIRGENLTLKYSGKTSTPNAKVASTMIIIKTNFVNMAIKS